MSTESSQPEFEWIPQWKGLAKVFLEPQKKQEIANGRSLRVFVHPWGFHWINGKDEFTSQWSEVVAIFRHVTRHSTNLIPTHTEYSYTVHLKGGPWRRVKANLPARAAAKSRSTRLQAVPGTTIPVTIEQLGRLLESGVTRDQLPKAIVLFNAGQTVSFGPLKVTPAGLSSGTDLVPWAEVQGVATTHGFVQVKKAGKWLAWKTVPVAKIPNYFVFDALVQAILAQRQHALPGVPESRDAGLAGGRGASRYSARPCRPPCHRRHAAARPPPRRA
jgi:hypothetical protein